MFANGNRFLGCRRRKEWFGFTKDDSTSETKFNFQSPEKENQYLIREFIYHVDLSFIFAQFYPSPARAG